MRLLGLNNYNKKRISNKFIIIQNQKKSDSKMFKDLSEDEKELYLDVLRDGEYAPFDNFVSRGNLPDAIDIDSPRNSIDRQVFRAIKATNRDKATRLIPILGSAGSGKTHAYWAYKDIESELRKKRTLDIEEADWRVVYVPAPPASIRVLLHVYTCIIDDLGSEMLDMVSSTLVTRWSGRRKIKRKHIDTVIQNGLKEFPGVYSDCVKVLVTYRGNKEKRALALRWLLGEDLELEELKQLGVNSVIEEDDICLAMIKMITENLDTVLVLYFDELESPYRMHGEEAERKFLEVLKKLYNEIRSLVIVVAVLKEIWPRLLEIMDQPLRQRMEQEQELKPFSLNDVKLFYAKTMEDYWDKANLNPPLYPLFPLNEKVVDIIYEKSLGNPRDTIKLCSKFIDKIIDGEMTLEDLASDKGDIIATAQPPQLTPKYEFSPQESESEIRRKIEEMLADEKDVVDITPQAVAGAALKSIITFGERNSKNFKTQMEFKFTKNEREYGIAAMIEYDTKKWGLEIPSIKSFDRSGGVAAFYAARRLRDAIKQGTLNNAILIVPEGTAGAKFTMKLEKTPEIRKVEINNDIGEDLIIKALNYPSKVGWDIARMIFGEIEGYHPPVEEVGVEREPPSEENE
jgi:hypothetical protein